MGMVDDGDVITCVDSIIRHCTFLRSNIRVRSFRRVFDFGLFDSVVLASSVATSFRFIAYELSFHCV